VTAAVNAMASAYAASARPVSADGEVTDGGTDTPASRESFLRSSFASTGGPSALQRKPSYPVPALVRAAIDGNVSAKDSVDVPLAVKVRDGHGSLGQLK